jgi:hypothetical protein
MAVRTGGVGVLSLACVLAGTAFAQKSDEQKPTKKDPLYKIGAYAGKVLEADPDGRTLKLRVYGKTAVPTYNAGNPKA